MLLLSQSSIYLATELVKLQECKHMQVIWFNSHSSTLLSLMVGITRKARMMNVPERTY